MLPFCGGGLRIALSGNSLKASGIFLPHLCACALRKRRILGIILSLLAISLQHCHHYEIDVCFVWRTETIILKRHCAFGSTQSLEVCVGDR